METKVVIEGARPAAFENIYSGKFLDRSKELKAVNFFSISFELN